MVIQSASVGIYEGYFQLAKDNAMSSMRDNRKVEDEARQQQQQFVSNVTNFYGKDANQQRTQDLNGRLGQNVNLFA